MGKKETLTFAGMDQEDVMPSEVGQAERGGCCVASLRCGIEKKRKKAKTHRNIRKVVAKALGGEGNGESRVK